MNKPGVVQRMEIELEELTDRLGRAKGFVGSETFNHLPTVEQDIFKQQVFHMEGYEKALRDRLGLICKRLGI